jgi:hypothetical protein
LSAAIAVQGDEDVGIGGGGREQVDHPPAQCGRSPARRRRRRNARGRVGEERTRSGSVSPSTRMLFFLTMPAFSFAISAAVCPGTVWSMLMLGRPRPASATLIASTCRPTRLRARRQSTTTSHSSAAK